MKPVLGRRNFSVIANLTERISVFRSPVQPRVDDYRRKLKNSKFDEKTLKRNRIEFFEDSFEYRNSPSIFYMHFEEAGRKIEVKKCVAILFFSVMNFLLRIP